LLFHVSPPFGTATVVRFPREHSSLGDTSGEKEESWEIALLFVNPFF
jgi:hypothetical protein